MKKIIIIIFSAILFCALLLSSCTGSDAKNSPTEEDLSMEANSLVEELAANDYAGAKRNHKYGFVMGMLTGRKTLETIWSSLITQYGDYVRVYEYEYQKVTGYENIIIKIAFEKKCIDFKVTFNEGTLKISGLHYSVNADKPSLQGADTPTLPEGVSERSLSFGMEGAELPAILTYPSTGSNFPLLVLVHGSGPNDADESIGAQAPFRDIAWGLAQQGIAVLRYDKRTLVYPESFGEDDTVIEETVDDAVAAVLAAIDFSEIDSANIFVLGHSLGGTMIPEISLRATQAKGFIMMSAAVTPLHQLTAEQVEYIYNLDGKLTIRERLSLYQTKQTAKRISNLTIDSDKKSSALFGVSQSYWLYLLEYDVLERVQTIETPLLIIQGESDYQVPMRDFEALEQALDGRDNVSFISYPGLSHLMTTSGNPPSPDDYYNDYTVDQSVIDDIAAFITSN